MSESIDELVALWKKTRSPRLADAIDQLSKPVPAWERIGKLPGSRAKTAVLRLSKLEDPRLATLYLKWLTHGYWPAPTAKPVWTRIFEHLAKLRDARVTEPLRAIAKAPPAFVGVVHRVWVATQIGGVVRRLATAKPPADTTEVTAVLARMRPVAKSVAPDPKRVVEAVWKDPTDLELRQVVADALLEHGDPWGELITIQLRGAKATAPARTRARALERKHGAEWLGAIGKLTLDASWRFENGFPVTIGLDRRAVPRRDYEAALHAREWSTIETVRVSETPQWWVTAWVKSSASRNVRAFELAQIKEKRPAMRIERDLGGPWRLAQARHGVVSMTLPMFRAFVAGLAPSERVRVAIADVADRDAYAAALRG